MRSSLIIMGPPGAGKGTQAQLLSERLGIPTFSTGELFRKLAAEGTDLGLKAKEFIDKGEYVPDEVTNAIVRTRLGHEDATDGFLLDGYPRTLDQVNELDSMLGELNKRLDAVIEIKVDRDEIVGRLLKRAEIEGRADDTAEVIGHRMDVYTEQTQPLSDIYAKRGILIQVDGDASVGEVTERILVALRDSLYPGQS